MPIEGSALERPKADPSVQMPLAVKRAAERADELSKQIQEAKQVQETKQNEDTEKVGAPPTINSSSTVITDFDPANPQPPQTDNLAPPQTQPQPQPDTLEHQFKSLQGRYSKADEENRRLAAHVNDLQRMLATVSAPPPPQAQPQGSGVRFTGPVVDAKRRVSDKEIDDYGKEFIDVVGRRAMEVQEAAIQPVLSQLQNELAGIRQQLGSVTRVQATDAQDRLWTVLDREIPNWEIINSSPEFVRWLQAPDGMSGFRRYDLLDDAFKQQQAGRVLEAFRRYMMEAGIAPTHTQPVTHTQPQPSNGGGNGQLDLAAFAAPGRAKAGSPVDTAQKRIYTRADIKRFYQDKTQGVYAGRQKEADDIEMDFMAAQRENRIR